MRKIKHNVLFIITVITVNTSFGQNQGNIWYFGGDFSSQTSFGAGLDFNFTPPVALTNSGMMYTEGSAVYCDNNGQLLFYTNGETVFDNTHNTMSNGSNLGGHFSTEQSCLIVPFINNKNSFYIFTNDGALTSNGTGLKYSIVDLTLNAGLGAITTKATPLLPNTSEQLAGVNHSNGYSFWIVTTEYNTGIFYVYKVDDCGVSSPIVSDVGFNTTMNFGKIKVSPKNNKIAVRIGAKMYLLDFDNTTGKVANPLNIHTSSNVNQGFCFSPDGNLFYEKSNFGLLTFSDSLLQYNLNDSDISASRLLIASSNTLGFYYISDIQIAPNGKIYMNQNCNDCLDAINSPNIRGLGCNFEQTAVTLSGKFAGILLPNSLLIGTNSESCNEKPDDTVNSTTHFIEDFTPNIFTPNNDGINDEFKIKINNSADFKCKIYNRWGEVVGKLNETNQSWDGRTKSGLSCPSGVYFFVIEYRNSGNKNLLKKGFLQLIK